MAEQMFYALPDGTRIPVDSERWKAIQALFAAADAIAKGEAIGFSTILLDAKGRAHPSIYTSSGDHLDSLSLSLSDQAARVLRVSTLWQGNAGLYNRSFARH